MALLSRPRNGNSPEHAAVEAAAAGVRDPEIGAPLGELGMLRGVMVGRGGEVHVEVALTTPTCPMVDRLRADVERAVGAVDGVRRVEVTFGALSERERSELAGSLRRQADARRPVGSRSPAARVYAVASGKGGVGKSSVTVNLAAQLARDGQRVGVLDADVWGYSVPGLLGVRRTPVALAGLMLPVQAHGIAMMSTGFFVAEDEPVVWRGPMLHKALEQFLGDVAWGELDVLLLDLPPGTGDVTLSVLELLPEAALLAVTTPQPAAQSVAARVGRMARDARMPVAGVIENMSELVCAGCGTQTALFGSGGGRRLAESVDAPLLGQIPLDLALREAGDAGTPVVLRNPETPSARELARIAGALPVVRRGLVGVSLPLSVV